MIFRDEMFYPLINDFLKPQEIWMLEQAIKIQNL